MWRRLISRGPGGGGAAGAASAPLEAAGPEAAARSALGDWAAELDGQPRGAPAQGDDPLARAVRLILAVPRGEGRDAIIQELGAALPRAFASVAPPEPAEQAEQAEGAWFDPHLSMLSDCFECKELRDAAVAVFAALQDDARLLQLAAELAPREGEDSEPAHLRLATSLRGATSSQAALARCGELLRARKLALHQAEMLLGGPLKQAKQRAEEAAQERSAIQDDLAERQKRVGGGQLGTLEKQGVEFETEVNRLSELKRELRLELDKVNRQQEDALARQRAHMTQVDGWRSDKDKVKETTVRSKEETAHEAASAGQEGQTCQALLARLRGMQGSMPEAVAKAESEAAALGSAADDHYGASAAGVVEAAEARLQAAMRCTTRLREDHARAKETLELLEVKGSDRGELPTRKALAGSLGTLRDAWAARATLGDVELQRRGEVEAFIRESSEEGGCGLGEPAEGPSLAEAKASWAQRWSELGDVCGLLDAAASGTPRGVAGFAAGGAGGGEPSDAPSPVALPSLDDDDEPLLMG